MSADDPPRTAKESAVEQWRSAVADLPESKLKRRLRLADIHDSEDRREIEDAIEYDAPDDHYLPLHDAWHDLERAFDDLW